MDVARHKSLVPPQGAKESLTYQDPQRRFVLQLPQGWKIQKDTPDRTVIKEQRSLAELAVSYLAEDCAVAQSKLRARRLNYYFIREFTRTIADREALVFEFRDTITNVREFHAFLPVDKVCCELKWTRPESSQGPEFDPTLEEILSTFRFGPNKS
jgi:hypothetical protein